MGFVKKKMNKINPNLKFCHNLMNSNGLGAHGEARNPLPCNELGMIKKDICLFSIWRFDIWSLS